MNKKYWKKRAKVYRKEGIIIIEGMGDLQRKFIEYIYEHEFEKEKLMYNLLQEYGNSYNKALTGSIYPGAEFHIFLGRSQALYQTLAYLGYVEYAQKIQLYACQGKWYND